MIRLRRSAPIRRPGAADGSILAADVFCLYPISRGTVAALRGLTLSVEPGERLVVHGPNGSGKTSLLRVLTGEVSPSAGSVRVAGVDLAGADDRTRASLRRRRLGIVDQHSSRVLRPELDVLDNVAMQSRINGARRNAARETARDLLEELHLGDLAGRHPDQLSGGQAQRVAVCAALAHGPQVVLADEPSGELDVDSADEVYDLLVAAAARNGATLLVVSHDARAGRIADRVVRIRDGRLSEQWSPAAPGDEELVVDDRGWVRLPEPMRHAAGARRSVRAGVSRAGIVLTGQDPPQPDRPTRTRVGAPAGAPGHIVARLRGVTLRYGARTVLHQLDLDLASSSVTVLRGRSGSGKSTLLRVLLGLTDPDAGEATLAGTVLSGLSRTARADLRRSNAAVALQFGALAEALNVRENVALALALRGLPSDDALIATTIDEVALSALQGRAVRLMSGGERQRVALARCLVVRRPVIVLDEPSSAQDEAHAELVGTALRAAAARGAAVLAATHDPSLIAIADRVVDLADPDQA